MRLNRPRRRLCLFLTATVTAGATATAPAAHAGDGYPTTVDRHQATIHGVQCD